MYGVVYGVVMRVLHKFHLHYAPPIYPGDDIQLWCKWCGFRMTVVRARISKSRDEGPKSG